MVSIFQVDAVTDQAIRREFAFLETRAASIAEAVTQAYGRPAGAITFRYIEEREFNACARLTGNGYRIELNAAIPLFNLILFYRLMSDARVLPELDASGATVSDFALPFVIDPSDFDRRQDWRIGCNAIRAFAAGTLADLCNSFVLLHEFAHILCGHCEAIRHFEGDDAIVELVSVERVTVASTARRLGWEGDADGIAAALLAQFVEQLADEIARNGRTAEVFADPGGFHLERTAAIAVATLFALFCYIEGARRRLDKADTHPHPQVRALLVKNVLLGQLEGHETFDAGIFHAYLDARLDEMMIVLESVGLFDPKGYTVGFSRGVDRALRRVKLLQERHRSDCAAWAWLDWNDL